MPDPVVSAPAPAPAGAGDAGAAQGHPPGWDAALAEAAQPQKPTSADAEAQGASDGGNAAGADGGVHMPVPIPSPLSPEGRRALDMLGGTTTPALVLRALQKDMLEVDAKAALAEAIHTRAQGAREVRAQIRAFAAQGTPVSSDQVMELVAKMAQTQPTSSASPAIRSLLRSNIKKEFGVADEAKPVLNNLYPSYGYSLVTPRMANGVLANITEADQTAARLIARTSGAWHPEAGHPRPAEARVPVAVVDDGFAVDHPLLASKVVNPDVQPGGDPNADTPTTYPPESAKDHGTVVAAVASANTHVVDVQPRRHTSLSGESWGGAAQTLAAARHARVVNRSFTSFSPGSDQGRAALEAHAEHHDTLFTAAAGNQNPDLTDEEKRGNQALTGLPNTMVVAGLDAQGTPRKEAFVYYPDADLAACGHFMVPTLKDGMQLQHGSSYAAPTVANTAALASALAPHLPMQDIKRLIEGTTTPTPAWEAAGGAELARNPPLDRDRALRLAAVAGLVKNGTPDARRNAATDAPSPPRLGMTPEQAANALKLKPNSAERAQALADYARFSAEVQAG